jgi:hypothetical protein
MNGGSVRRQTFFRPLFFCGLIKRFGGDRDQTIAVCIIVCSHRQSKREGGSLS